jgi:hypothetical protein
LVPGYHGGMFNYNTRRVLLSFRIVFLTFDLCFRQVISDISKGDIVTIILAIALFYYKEYYSCLLLFLFWAGHRCPKEAIMTVAGGKILDET